MVRRAFFAHPISQQHYEPLGTLVLEFGHKWDDVTNYRRCLDLESGTIRVQYEHKGVDVEREIFASCPDAVIAIRIRASQRAEFVVRLSRMSELECETHEYLDDVIVHDNSITMHATPGGRNSNSACCTVPIRCDDDNGAVTKVGNSLLVNSRDVLLLVTAQTTYRHDSVDETVYSDLTSALGYSTEELWTRHTKDYLSLYRRMGLQMGPDACSIPTDERIKDSRDAGLMALYHNYCRYLLISCSRDGEKSLPATLQGIGNPSFHPLWGCNEHKPAYETLACEDEQSSRMRDTVLRSPATARGGRETSCAEDISGYQQPFGPWEAWLCTHIWEHFRFSGNEKFLRKMFPVLRGRVEFLLDFLIEDASGKYLVTSPSVSPENSFYGSQGSPRTSCEGSTQLVNAVLNDFTKSAEALGIDDELISAVRRIQRRLPPMRIGSVGQLQEWPIDFAEVEPGHRHVSHLWALYPGDTILPDKTPGLAESCSKTLQRRESSGGGHTGWSRAWLINLHARLRAAEHCAKHLDLLLAQSTLPNMLDTIRRFKLTETLGLVQGSWRCSSNPMKKGLFDFSQRVLLAGRPGLLGRPSQRRI